MKKLPSEWNFEKKERDQRKRLVTLRFFFSAALGLFGIIIIFSQLIPLTNSLLQGKLLEKQFDNIATPLPDSYKQYIQGEFAYYAPGQNYFSNLTSQAQRSYRQSTINSKDITINTEYKNDMWVNINSVGINKIRISSNVESSEP